MRKGGFVKKFDELKKDEITIISGGLACICSSGGAITNAGVLAQEADCIHTCCGDFQYPPHARQYSVIFSVIVNGYNGYTNDCDLHRPVNQTQLHRGVAVNAGAPLDIAFAVPLTH